MTASTGSMPAALTPAGGPPVGRASRMRGFTSLAWPLLALAALLVYNYFHAADFFRIEVKDGRLYGSLVDVLKNGTPVLLLALGMTLVIATGGIDLSVGAVMALSGAVAVSLMNPPEGSPFEGHATQNLALVFGAGLMTAVLCGVWNGVLVAAFRLQPIVATLILMVAGRGVAQLVTNGQIPTSADDRFARLGGGFLLGLPVPVLIAGGVTLVMLVTVRGTAVGLFVEAVGNNRVASRIAGVNATGTRLAAYTLCGALAGVAGLIGAADIKAADVNNLGLYLELDAILAVAVGGTSLAGGRFSLLGTVVGAIVIQTLTTTILANNYQPQATLVIKAGVVVALCLLQSATFRGLFRVRRGAA